MGFSGDYGKPEKLKNPDVVQEPRAKGGQWQRIAPIRGKPLSAAEQRTMIMGVYPHL
jgi:hypothetical protein